VQDLVGTSLPVFIGLTVVVMGFASYMTGQALANTWRPAWHVLPYALLLGCADRFLVYGLFDGELWLLSGYVIDTAVLLAIGALAFRLNRARKMVSQYPWLYELTSPLTWREKGSE
jgi:hypothetical protein